MIYVVIMFCFGLMLGGFIFGNNTVGIIGLISGVVLIIYGLITNYIKYRHKTNDEQKNAFFSYYGFKPKNELLNNNNILRLYFDSDSGTVERCIEVFNKAETLLESEYNDYLFGIDLEGFKRPLAKKNNDKLQEILDESIDDATAAYLSIDDVIAYPWGRIKKSIQEEISSKYNEVTPYTTFLFLNDYFFRKYRLILVVYKNQETHFAEPKEYVFDLDI